MSFRAIVIEQTTDRGRITEHAAKLRELDDDFLTASGGERPIDIEVEYSDINYKDGMAIAGRPGIVKASPLIPGIDLVGRVVSSADLAFQPGDEVILTGDGIGETKHGGLSERARVNGDALVRRPQSLSAKRAAAIGTAGFTAMLSILALERAGVTRDSGPVAVTGASGGVGSVAVAILAKLGYEVAAITGRAQVQGDFLASLGAAEVLDRAEFIEAGAPLQQRRWAGAVDCVGSTVLANLLSQTLDNGTVTACGLAAGTDLPTTVLPFILRGVSLAGINSVTASRTLRQQAWDRLASDLPFELLDSLTEETTLEGAFHIADEILAGRVRGRTVVKLA